jgi:hypothetical protein
VVNAGQPECSLRVVVVVGGVLFTLYERVKCERGREGVRVCVK